MWRSCIFPPPQLTSDFNDALSALSECSSQLLFGKVNIKSCIQRSRDGLFTCCPVSRAL